MLRSRSARAYTVRWGRNGLTSDAHSNIEQRRAESGTPYPRDCTSSVITVLRPSSPFTMRRTSTAEVLNCADNSAAHRIREDYAKSDDEQADQF